MKTTPSKPIPPTQEDFKLLDSYINFSYEVMKFAILSIAGVWAALIALINPQDELQSIFSENHIRLKLSLAIIFLISAVLFSLAHRYTASNSMANWMAYVREEDKGVNKCLKKARNRGFRLSGVFIVLASFSLILGLAISGILLYAIINR